jgi:thiosulfate reductase cytochrome b subunit
VALAVLAAGAVLAVRWLVGLEGVRAFLATHPGEYELAEGAPVGLPAWLGWQHFFNAFFLVLIVRTGLQIRYGERPSAFWTSRRTGTKVNLAVWLHQSLDLLWVINGLLYIALLFATGQWVRVTPTSWEVFPNALSALLQYISLDWPTENGWTNYNSLQQLAYSLTIFVAAPLAMASGLRMSTLWPRNRPTLDRIYPIGWARRLHFPVMLYFVAFTVAHLTLVLATGALRNLNHMYTSRDVIDGIGLAVFAGSLLVTSAVWLVLRPAIVAQVARLFGVVSSR